MSTTATKVMTTKEIAKKLKKYCEQGEFETAQKELFAKDAISIEPMAGGGFDKETKGLDAIIKKGEKWSSMVTATHSMEISEPMIAGNTFSDHAHGRNYKGPRAHGHDRTLCLSGKRWQDYL